MLTCVDMVPSAIATAGADAGVVAEAAHTTFAKGGDAAAVGEATLTAGSARSGGRGAEISSWAAAATDVVEGAAAEVADLIASPIPLKSADALATPPGLRSGKTTPRAPITTGRAQPTTIFNDSDKNVRPSNGVHMQFRNFHSRATEVTARVCT